METDGARVHTGGTSMRKILNHVGSDLRDDPKQVKVVHATGAYVQCIFHYSTIR